MVIRENSKSVTQVQLLQQENSDDLNHDLRLAPAKTYDYLSKLINRLDKTKNK
jgi:hypothetical protein